MFQIFHNGILIGVSALETGDPPMGIADGDFIPLEGFESFRASVSPEPDKDPDIKRWLGLTLATSKGDPIECNDVVLFEYDFGDHKEFQVDAVGIGYPLYEELFPGRHAAYGRSFTEIAAWHEAANDLKIEITAPCAIDLGQFGVFRATVLVRQFGAKNGMVADPSWNVLEAFTNALLEAGYGYSCIKLGKYRKSGMIEVLRDWGWTGSHHSKPRWLKD